MRYYVISDTHGYYDETVKALGDAGYFFDTSPKKLILCGDMMDRGSQAMSMQAFMRKELSEGRLVFIRGNHEDLMMDFIKNYEDELWEIFFQRSIHCSNGTFDTALQLAEMPEGEAFRRRKAFLYKVQESSFVKILIPSSANYYETKNYIFVHGFIPVEKISGKTRKKTKYEYDADWRRAGDAAWKVARWMNGMELVHDHKITIPEKTIVCGHWNASFGHSKYEKSGSQFGGDAIHSPYSERGLLAVDGCTALSGTVNCVVIEDEEICYD